MCGILVEYLVLTRASSRPTINRQLVNSWIGPFDEVQHVLVALEGKTARGTERQKCEPFLWHTGSHYGFELVDHLDDEHLVLVALEGKHYRRDKTPSGAVM